MKKIEKRKIDFWLVKILFLAVKVIFICFLSQNLTFFDLTFQDKYAYIKKTRFQKPEFFDYT